LPSGSFAGIHVRLSQHHVRAANDTGHINMKLSIAPRCRLSRKCVPGRRYLRAGNIE
jgi:hypothetical protein